ncbi:MAG: Ni/Fe hydrogenase subunit gamma, partial [Persephonella sp.]|nr:Ni/Fe hydrogenase subunit gamma [Persephonella sp.]
MIKAENPYKLKECRIVKKIKETPDTYSFWIEYEGDCSPGQYNMIYYFGVGEAPITIAGKEKI